MLRYAFILCAFLIQCGIQGVYAGKKTSPVRADVASLMPNIEKYIEQYRDIFQTPGMALVVVKDGKVYTQSFGTLSLSDNTPVDADTVFQMASVTKNFTATLITILAQKGVLSLDDKVKKYLPDFELADKNISDDLRIRDLLCHCVGLDDFAGDSLWHGNLPQEEVVHNMRYLPFKAKFRETYGYSNIMVGIAGIVVEKATGKPLANVMQEEIYGPLG
ncbi:MAG: beta-lactamase family protein, partial [Alphaproteobacteria bacterium]|nr:beta-lactamase family protein [Alphaproteobacteria bacterium]